MPIIRVEMFAGRSREQKQQLVRELTDAVARTCTVNPDVIDGVISVVDRDNRAFGGELCSERFPD